MQPNTTKNILIILRNLPQIHPNLLQQKIIYKTSKANGDLNGKIIADKITNYK